MNVQRSLIVLIVILLASLIAFSCGDDEGQDGNPPGDSNAEAFDEDIGTFGERYPLKKLADFRFLARFRLSSGEDLSLSQARKLGDDLFKDSIKSNNVAHYGDKGQRYTYVVDSNDKVFVAIWRDGISPERLENILKSEACRDSDFTPDVEAGMMINFFPEEPFPKDVQPKESPCWLPKRVGGGLLDALSKHFMLAQGQGATIANFTDATENDWILQKVDYAGEIHVDIETCTYSVDRDSGTYKPQDAVESRQALFDLFSSEVGVAPAEVNGHRLVKAGDASTKIPGAC